MGFWIIIAGLALGVGAILALVIFSRMHDRQIRQLQKEPAADAEQSG